MTDVITVAKPFLKWPGRKSQLLPELRKFYPSSIRCYHEPFVGSGAVFLDLFTSGKLDKALVYLSDSNPELINTLKMVRDQLEPLIGLLKEHTVSHRACQADHYYKTRASRPGVPVVEAARTIYLNKTCFNGVYRVNSKGEFNVALGAYKNPGICDEANLTLVSRALQGVNIACEDYSESVKMIQQGDFVYFDPPYVPVSKTANFTGFTKDKFQESQHLELAAVMGCLDRKGVWVLASNSDSPVTQGFYGQFAIYPVQARRSVNCDASKRGMAKEIIVCSRRLQEICDAKNFNKK